MNYIIPHRQGVWMSFWEQGKATWGLYTRRKDKLVCLFKIPPWLPSEEELQGGKRWNQETSWEAWPWVPAEERERADQLGQSKKHVVMCWVGDVRRKEEQRRTVIQGWYPLFMWGTGCHSTGKGRWEEETGVWHDYWVLCVSHCSNHCIRINDEAGVVTIIILIL